MKLYNRQEFMKLPEGTIYLKGGEWYFHDLSLKGETIFSQDGEPIDWGYLAFNDIDSSDSPEHSIRLEEMLHCGASFPMEECFGRDGCFDETDIFLVLEKPDLLVLRSHIDKALEL